MTDLITLTATTHDNGLADINMRDGNTATYYGGGSSYTSIHRFSKQYRIREIKLRSYTYGNSSEGDATWNINCHFYYSIDNGSNWLHVPSTEYTLWFSLSHSGRGDEKKYLNDYPSEAGGGFLTTDVDVADVNAVKVSASTNADDQKQCYLYELQVFAGTGGSYCGII